MTIDFTPIAYASVHDDLVYTVEEPTHVSDPVLYPNYKFIGDVYINAVLVARLKKFPDPVTGIGIFNVGQVVRNYIACAFDPTPNVIVAQKLGDTEFNITVTMHFGEEYSFTDHLDIVVDSPRTFFNNYNGRGGSLNSLLATFFLDKVASIRPTALETLLTSNNLFLPYFPTTTAAVNYIVTPTGGGISYSTTFTPTANFELQILNLSPVAINAAQPGTITAATTSYTVQIGGQTYTVNIICESLYEVFTVHFLNKFGGFETKIFPKVNRQTFDIAKKDFGRLPYDVDGSGVVTYATTNRIYNEGRAVYSSLFTEKRQLNTDWITDAEYLWLVQLLISPMVYLELSGDYFPFVISDTGYEIRKNVNDDLTNLTINIEYGITMNAQFR